MPKQADAPRYIIHKAGRLPVAPYTGPSCNAAGVPIGKVYADFREALSDARKLREVSAVGFCISVTEREAAEPSPD